MPVSIVTDSLASIPAEDARSAGIEIVPLYVSDGERNERDIDIDIPAFYRRLEDMRTLPTSSQPSLETLMDAFRRALDHGSEVLGIFVSAKMSGTLETARLAAGMVAAEKPGARIEVVDSESNCMVEGFEALSAAQAARDGATLERCIEAAHDTLVRSRWLFSPESLEYLRRGGRIGAASALLGGLLQVKPILTVENGETTTVARVRTHTKALAEIVRMFAEDIAAHGLTRVIVHYIGEHHSAEVFAREQIEPIVGSPVRVMPVSPVIGLHTGPSVGIVYEMEHPWR